MGVAEAVSKPGRGLRARLTFSYILLFSVVLAGIGISVSQLLTALVREQAEMVLAEEWGTLLAYMRLEGGQLRWAYDPEDPEQAFALQRLQGVLLVADSRGKIIEISNGYRALGGEQAVALRDAIRAQNPRFFVRREAGGNEYLIRIGKHREQGEDYAVALGMPMMESSKLPGQFRRIYFLAAPALLAGIGVAGWFAARRALMPLKNLAEAARSISEGNLSLRIREPGGRDEIGNLVDTFNRMMDRLERSFNQTRQFTVDASHELKTPLTAVRGQLEVALLTAQTPEQFRDAIVAAMSDVERLSQISKTLVQLARAESGQIRLRRTEEDLAEIVEAAISMFEAAAGEKRIRLETSLWRPCRAEVDRGLMEQLVYEIVSNAMQFTPAGGMVKVELMRRRGEAVLSVSDTGPGMGEEHLGKIFQRFYRVRTGNSSAGGAGLGLAWAAWIAQAHGGRIEARSAEGQGSTFVTHLPEREAG